MRKIENKLKKIWC